MFIHCLSCCWWCCSSMRRRCFGLWVHYFRPSTRWRHSWLAARGRCFHLSSPHCLTLLSGISSFSRLDLQPTSASRVRVNPPSAFSMQPLPGVLLGRVLHLGGGTLFEPAQHFIGVCKDLFCFARFSLVLYVSSFQVCLYISPMANSSMRGH